MVSLILLIASGGGCWLTSRMLESHIDPAKIGEQVEKAQSHAFREMGTENGPTLIIRAGLPEPAEVSDGLPDEIREVVNPK